MALRFLCYDSWWERFTLVLAGMIAINFVLVIRLWDFSSPDEPYEWLSWQTLRRALFALSAMFTLVGIVRMLLLRSATKKSGKTDARVITGVHDRSFDAIGAYASLVSVMMVDVDKPNGLLLLVFIWAMFAWLFYQSTVQLLNPTFLLFGYRLLCASEDIAWDDDLKIDKGSYILVDRDYRPSDRVSARKIAFNLFYAGIPE